MKLLPPSCAAEFDERIRCLCAIHDCSQTSGIRSPTRNAMVGGSPKSKHLSSNGWASDLVPDANTKTTRDALVIDALKLSIHPYDETDHVHMQWPPPGE